MFEDLKQLESSFPAVAQALVNARTHPADPRPRTDLLQALNGVVAPDLTHLIAAQLRPLSPYEPAGTELLKRQLLEARLADQGKLAFCDAEGIAIFPVRGLPGRAHMTLDDFIQHSVRR